MKGISIFARANPAFTPDVTDLGFEPIDGEVKVGGQGDSVSNADGSSSGCYSVEDQETGDGASSSDRPSQNGDKDKTGNTGEVQMKQSLNLVHCVAIMVAVTGHSSVFISPSNILRTTGSIGGALVVWFVGGIINMMLALCFAELGTMLPKAGGPYAYVMHTFGPLPGFLIMWGYVVLIAGPFWAFLSYTAALYIIQPIFPDCEAPDEAVRILAGWIMSKFACFYRPR